MPLSSPREHSADLLPLAPALLICAAPPDVAPAFPMRKATGLHSKNA